MAPSLSLKVALKKAIVRDRQPRHGENMCWRRRQARRRRVVEGMLPSNSGTQALVQDDRQTLPAPHCGDTQAHCSVRPRFVALDFTHSSIVAPEVRRRVISPAPLPPGNGSTRRARSGSFAQRVPEVSSGTSPGAHP